MQYLRTALILIFFALSCVSCILTTPPNTSTVTHGNTNEDKLVVWGRVSAWQGSYHQSLLHIPPPDQYHLELHTYHNVGPDLLLIIENEVKNNYTPLITKEVDRELAIELFESGNLYPVSRCSNFDSDLNDFDPNLRNLDLIRYEGELLGLPVAISPRVLFYNKLLLQELGWNAEEIDSLAERIIDGSFTLDDVIRTAEQATKAGVVREELAFWQHRSDERTFLYFYAAHGGTFIDNATLSKKLILSAADAAFSDLVRLQDNKLTHSVWADLWVSSWGNRTLSYDTIGTSQVLFWIEDLEVWPRMEQNYFLDMQKDKALDEIVGFAPIPAGTSSEKSSPHFPFWVHTFYILMSPDKDQALIHHACDLFTHMVLPAYQTSLANKNRIMAVTALENNSLKSSPSHAKRLNELKRLLWDFPQLDPELGGSLKEQFFLQNLEIVLQPILSEVSKKEIAHNEAAELLAVRLKQIYPDLVIED